VNKKQRVLSISLAIMLFGLGACTTPNNPAGNLGNNSNTQQNQNINSNISDNIASQTADDLSSYHEDEATFSDSEKLANQENGFSTQSLKDILGDKPKPEPSAKPNSSPSAVNADVRSEVKADISTRLEASGAITKNPDGTVTVDKDKLKAEVKTFISEHKVEIQARIEKIKDKLKDKKEVAKEKIQKLKNKLADVRTSNVVQTTNADGSITNTMSVEFKTENMAKENIVSKTTKDGKIISIDHSLNITAKAFTRTSSRIITFNADGSKKIVTESTTTFKDGRKREVSETRNIDTSGNGSGTGTITVTTADGKTTTKNLDTKVSTSESGDEKVATSSKDGNTQVTVDEGINGKATATVKEDGKETSTSDIDIQAKEETSASASVTSK
jgi:hypothetical protein